MRVRDRYFLTEGGRFSIVIQGNLPEADLKNAKAQAVNAVQRLKTGDTVGVATFTDAIHDIRDWTVLKNQDDINAVIKDINDIKPETGTVNLEASLRQEMNAIAKDASTLANRTIFLFTNGPGSSSEALSTDMRVNDVVVNVFSQSGDDTTAAMKSLNTLSYQTLGDFVPRSGSAAGMP